MPRILPALALLFACDPGEAPHHAPAALSPMPTQSLTLAMDPIRGGQPAWVEVSGAAPGATVDLVRSDGGFGAGPCPSLIGGLCMDILPGTTGYLPTLAKTAGPAGVARWRIGELPVLPDRDWWFQAVVRDGANSASSNALARPYRACPTDALEPNDTQATAVPWVPGTSPLSVCPGAPDHYVVTVPPGQYLWAQARETGDAEGGEIRVLVYDESGRVLSLGGDEANERNVTSRTATWVLAVEAIDDFGDAFGTTYALDVAVNPAGSGGPCLDDAFEDDDTLATAFVASDDETRVACPVDDDWLAYDVGVDERVEWSFESRYDTTVEVYFASGAVLDLGADDAFRGTFDTPGRHHLRVRYDRSGDEGTTVPYWVTARRTSLTCIEDPFEDNDTVATATPITTRSVQGVACPGDDDVFALDVDAGDTVQVERRRTWGTADATLEDASGAVLATVGTFGPTTYPSPAAQTLYLRVAGDRDYAFDVDVFPGAPCIDDALEPNDAFGSARPIAFGDEVAARSCPSDSDYYALPAVPSGARIRLAADAAPGEEIELELFNPNGNRIATGFGFAPIYVDRTAGAPGVYVARMTAVSDDPTVPGVPYVLRDASAVPGACADDVFEDNDVAAAAPLVTNGVFEAYACFEDADFFAIDADVGDRVFARASTTGIGDGGVRMTLLDAVGTPVGVRFGDGTEHTLTSPGPVYVEVVLSQDDTRFDGAAYELETYVSAAATCAADAFEPNDTLATAVPMPGDSLDAVGCVGDDDAYTFDADVGELIRLSVPHEDATFENVDIAVYDPSGALIDESSWPFDTDVVTWSVETPGPHTVVVTTVADGIVPDGVGYTVQLERFDRLPCAVDVDEPNDTQATAVPLPFDTTVFRQACLADDDWYTFQGSAGTRIEMDLYRQRADGSVVGDLYDAAGTYLSSVTGFRVAEYDVPADGPLFLHVNVLDDEPFTPTGVAYELTVREF